MDQNQTTRHATCELCQQDGGMLVLRTDKLRVIRVADADYPGFYRVIWNDHVAEFTDLVPADRSHLMQAVARWEPLCEPHCSHHQGEPGHTRQCGAAFALARDCPLRGRPPFPQPIWGQPQREVPSVGRTCSAACPRGRPGNSTGTDGFQGLRPLIIGSTGSAPPHRRGSRLLLGRLSAAAADSSTSAAFCCVI